MRRLAALALVAAVAVPHAAARSAARKPPAGATLAGASNAMAIDLYRQVAATPGNLVFSPLSIHLALGMTYLGARGDTAAEMAKVLHVDGMAAADFSKGASALGAQLAALGKKKGTELAIANRLWAQKGFPFSKDFFAAVKKAYGAPVVVADFAADPDKERRAINLWVEQQTKKRIKDLLPEGLISAATRLVLVNAISFKASWREQFDKDATVEAAFTTQDGTNVKVPTMHRTGPASFADAGDARVLELRYRNGSDAAMVFLLPARTKDKDGGLAALEAKLTGAKLDEWLGQLTEVEEVAIALPRFTAETSFSLKDALVKLGMPRAFKQGEADFGGMLSKDATTGLFISAVVHKAFILVNEEGAEAAAATAVVMNGDSVAMTPSFVADRPFLYLIRDTKTGAILFMGRVVDPR
jgi:serpin B